jgi:hypothetical protein
VSELPEFQRKQMAFAAHIRDPQAAPPPDGIEDRRMAIYRELFFNNLLKLLSGTFPVLTKLHTAEKWRSLVREFMIRHRASTPYFLKIPSEFLEFLQNEYEAGADDFPFLLELAHYEWAELELSVSEDSNAGQQVEPNGDLLDGRPVQSRLSRLYAYRFPVHRISTDFIPDSPGEQPTYLVIYRKADDRLGFMELNPVTARLLELIGDNRDRSGRELLEHLAGELSYPDTAALLQHGKVAMQEMLDAEILTGVARSD